MKKFPACFPEDFESSLLPQGAEEKMLKVYRIIKLGKIDMGSFYSTFEETELGLRPKSKTKPLDPNDEMTYSTSCELEYDRAKFTMDISMRKPPKAFIAEGTTTPNCGPSQRTCERRKWHPSHVDWWIYKDTTPYESFKREVKHNGE